MLISTVILPGSQNIVLADDPGGNEGNGGNGDPGPGPEPLTISGQLRHNNEAGILVDSQYIKIEAWEKQALIDYKIAEGYTDNSGEFTFTHDTDGNPILNEDSSIGESGTRDIYFKFFAENEAARVSDDWIAGVLGITYWGDTDTDYDVSGPVYNVDITVTTDTRSPCLGIPSNIKADRDWLSSQTGGWTRDQLGILYPDSDWPNFFSIWKYNVMRIPDNWADSTTTLSHEYGHGIHWAARSGGLPDTNPVPTGEEDPRDGTPKAGQGSHWIYSESSGGFALTEGWAEFFECARHGDHLNLESNNYWMGADGNGANPPNIDGTTGEIVEGSFASILWDLYDGVGDDDYGGSFTNIWTIFETDDPDRVWTETANDDFYHYWTGRFGQTRAVDEIFINHGIPVIDDSYDSAIGNDDSAHASNIGNIEITKIVEDLIVVDIDWYKFTTSREGDANSEVVIEFDKNRGDLDLFVYHSDDALVGIGTEIPGGKRVSLDGEYADTFKIKVVGVGDDSGTAGIYEGDFSPYYDLKITPPAHPIDLIFTIDTTGSMWDDIAAVKSSAITIINEVFDDLPDSRIAVVDYKDFPVSPYGGSSDYPYRDVLSFSTDKPSIISAIQGLSASGGADWRESVYSALIHSIDSTSLGGWRGEEYAAKIIILMCDAPPHDPEPFTGYTALDVITAAINADPVHIYPIQIGGPVEKMQELAEGTGGSVFTAVNADEVVDAIIDAIREIKSKPVADANGPYEGYVNVPITLDATDSYDPDGVIVSYEWDLDFDGEYDDASGATPSYTWTTTYVGNIGLKVTDDDGLISITTTSVDISKIVLLATIDIDPDTLNLNSTGNWITCYIELPDGYDVEDINISTILLNDTIPAENHPTNISDYDNDGIPDLMVKFDRQEVIDILEPGENVEITVAGELVDGTRFEGIDYIRVI